MIGPLQMLFALATITIVCVTFLAAIGAGIPPELTATLALLGAAIAGGGAVKSADAATAAARDLLRKKWGGDDVA